jgi:hypothetical protein
VSYPGNHDLRLRVYFTRYCPALDDYHPFDLDVLLDFSGHGVILLPDFYPFAPGWIATHGHLGFSLSRIAGNTAMGAAPKIGKNVVMGHVHRMGVISEAVGYAGKLRTLTGIEVGHMMNVSKARYLKNGWGNWAAGFAVLELSGRLLPLNHGGSWLPNSGCAFQIEAWRSTVPLMSPPWCRSCEGTM